MTALGFGPHAMNRIQNHKEGKHCVCSITTVTSPACRVRAHRSGKLKELRELAAEFDATPASLQHAEAMDLQSKWAGSCYAEPVLMAFENRDHPISEEESDGIQY